MPKMENNLRLSSSNTSPRNGINCPLQLQVRNQYWAGLKIERKCPLSNSNTPPRNSMNRSRHCSVPDRKPISRWRLYPPYWISGRAQNRKQHSPNKPQHTTKKWDQSAKALFSYGSETNFKMAALPAILDIGPGPKSKTAFIYQTSTKIPTKRCLVIVRKRNLRTDGRTKRLLYAHPSSMGGIIIHSLVAPRVGLVPFERLIDS
jgi:hypothetical protein